MHRRRTHCDGVVPIAGEDTLEVASTHGNAASQVRDRTLFCKFSTIQSWSSCSANLGAR